MGRGLRITGYRGRGRGKRRPGAKAGTPPPPGDWDPGVSVYGAPLLAVEWQQTPAQPHHRFQTTQLYGEQERDKSTPAWELGSS